MLAPAQYLINVSQENRSYLFFKKRLHYVGAKIANFPKHVILVTFLSNCANPMFPEGNWRGKAIDEFSSFCCSTGGVWSISFSLSFAYNNFIAYTFILLQDGNAKW